MVEAARAIATVAHEGHKRKDGTPYILHPMHVADAVESDVAKAVAWLHDVVEDTFVTVAGLRQAGFPKEVYERVQTLTRRKGETYAEYIERVAQDEVTTEVKLADLDHNMSDQSSLDPDEVEFFNKRYGRALKRLEQI